MAYAKLRPVTAFDAKYNPDFFPLVSLSNIVYGVEFGSINLERLPTAYSIPGAYGSYL